MSFTSLKTRITPLLDTMSDALDHLEVHNDNELENGLNETRELVQSIIEAELHISLESNIHASALKNKEWLTTIRHIIEGNVFYLNIQNIYDAQFSTIVDQIIKQTEDELFLSIKSKYDAFKAKYPETAGVISKYYSDYSFWGTLFPENNDYSALKNRAQTVKRHIYDLIWLYQRLEDYRSKCTLIAILSNWLNIDTKYILAMKCPFSDYWDPDIFPDFKDGVIVDAGAYTGDTIETFIQTYGTAYKKIYAYEISPESVEKINENIQSQNWHDVIVRQKGVGFLHDKMFINRSDTSLTANALASAGEQCDSVEIVPLDDEEIEDVTFIKMDIEGAEYDALRGLKKTISTKHPKLAICLYHGYDDLWRLPSLIDNMYPGYKFYIRHFGGNLVPTEFVLLCK